MAATDHDDSDLSDRVECHCRDEDGLWWYWLKPGWEMPDGDKEVCTETEQEAITSLQTARQWRKD